MFMNLQFTDSKKSKNRRQITRPKPIIFSLCYSFDLYFFFFFFAINLSLLNLTNWIKLKILFLNCPHSIISNNVKAAEMYNIFARFYYSIIYC